MFWRFAPNWESDHTEAGLGASFEKVQQLDFPKAIADCSAALDHLGSQPGIAAAPAVMGFCLGGTIAWGVAAHAEPSCCVSYYGSGVPSMLGMLDQVSCPTLFHFGNNDSYIPSEGIDAIGAAIAGRPGFESERRDRRSRLRQPRERDVLRRECRAGRVGQDDGLLVDAPPGVRALVRRPGPRLAEGLVTHIERSPIDVDEAQRQWRRTSTRCEQHGWETIEVPGADDCPDAVFIEDTMVAFGDLAVISRPGAPSRQAETAAVSQTLRRPGLRQRPPSSLPAHSMEATY